MMISRLLTYLGEVDLHSPTFHSCYKSRLPIRAAKKMDLLSLCKTGVPNEHHHFFKNLPSSKKDAVVVTE